MIPLKVTRKEAKIKFDKTSVILKENEFKTLSEVQRDTLLAKVWLIDNLIRNFALIQLVEAQKNLDDMSRIHKAK